LNLQLITTFLVPENVIKGFFDNVSHGKLLKQMWTLGIKDKTLLAIISAMLKAEVAGIGFPEKGTPQGGIISPLLSNIVLNELDWWIGSQWEELPTRREFYGKIYENGTKDKSKKYRGLRTTKLKECYIVRYADDFKIFCRKHSDAVKLFEATKLWLKDRLGLDISPEKSQIVNLKHNYSEFLGFKIKVRKKGKTTKNNVPVDNYVVQSHVSDKALKKIHDKAAEHIKNIQLCKSKGETAEYYAVSDYNSYVMGVHNYYRMATCANADFQPLAYGIKQSIRIRLQERVKRRKNQAIPRYAIDYAKSREIRYIGKSILLPIGYVSHKPPIHKKKAINKFTREGRELIHKNLENVDMSIVHALMRNPVKGETIEYNDNRISIYVAQKGRCAITKELLSIERIHCHHKKPKAKGGGDEYANLIILDKNIHGLVHATDPQTIATLLSNFKLNKQQIEKLKKLRVLCKNEAIALNAEKETVN
jgi:5-methylcytosine-specific restriction endonuclease McrA